MADLTLGIIAIFMVVLLVLVLLNRGRLTGNASHNIHIGNRVTEEGSIPKIDLHGYHVEQALKRTKNFLCQFENQTRVRKVLIITGRGLHSEQGYPKIKLAVRNYLWMHNYKFEEVNDGGSLLVNVGLRNMARL